MVVNDEQEPLLLSSNNGISVTKYNSLNSHAQDTSLSLGLNHSQSLAGSSGDSSPTGLPISYPTENITYTWREINVTSTEQYERRRRFWNRVWKFRNVQRSGKKHILKHVTGVAYPGELIAIMGSSGAGKTTLLNTLTFRTPSSVQVSGLRALNGIPVNAKTIASLSAYVQQEDLFYGTLTVKEHLIFQAMVRMDRHIPYATRMIRVEDVISELALTKCQNTVIGIPGKLKGISGGEMKRLSFASEVLTNPPMMFCDEPTSGLDSFMAQNVVTVLKSLALKGKTVICTIHQPSSEVYAMFDKILLMAEGKMAFLGTPEEADSFFNMMGAACPDNYNPADYFIQLLAVVPTREETCRNMVELICDTFRHSNHGTRLMIATQSKYQNKSTWNDFWNSPRSLSPYKASWCEQFRAVLWRSMLNVKKQPAFIRVRLLQAIMVAVMIGVIFYGQKLNQDGVMNINGALFICITNMTFQHFFAVLHVFCSELPIFMREHLSGMYRTDVYFLCKNLSEVPIFIVVPVIFTSILYYMVGFNPKITKFLTATCVIVLVSNVSTSFGYFVSCLSSNLTVALSIGPPIIIPLLLFGGFFLNISTVPSYLKWFSYLSWFKYSNEALLINQWDGITSINCTRSNETCPHDGHVILETFSFSEDDYAFDFIALVGLIIAFRFLAFLSLLARTYITR